MSFPRYERYKNSGVEWLGEIPAHWQVNRLKQVAEVRGGVAKGRDVSGEDSIEVPYLRVANVQDGFLDLAEVATIQIPRGELNRYLLKPGDVLMNEGGDFDKLGRGHIWDGEIALCIHQNHVFCVRPTGIEAEWLNSITSADCGRFYFMTRSKQSTNLASISLSNLQELPIPCPPPDERQRILAFIEAEATTIDALVKQQRSLIELLKEKRRAVISHAVTKGIERDAPMKLSDIEWVGGIPAHWQILRLGALYSEVNEQGREELPVLRVSIHDGVSDKELDDDEYDRKVTRSDDRTKYKRVIPNDLTYNMMRAWQGGLGAVTVDGMVSPAYVVARPKRPLISKFIEYLLRTPCAIEEMRRRSYGVTDFRLRLYWDKFKDMQVGIPPVQEQETILDHIDQYVERISALERAASHAIELLKERRFALISAAMTGKIDVRQAALEPVA